MRVVGAVTVRPRGTVVGSAAGLCYGMSLRGRGREPGLAAIRAINVARL
jgi:hypothetical protein